MPQAKIPFAALTNDSELVVVSVNTQTRAYGPDGKVIEGAVGSPKLEVCALNTLDRYNVTVLSLEPALAAMTDAQITQSLISRQYIFVELVDAFATPFPARNGFGVSYSVRATSASKAPAANPFAKSGKIAASE